MVDDGLRKMMAEYVIIMENATKDLKRYEAQDKWSRCVSWFSDSVLGQVLLNIVLVASLSIFLLSIGKILKGL